jgi:hypothetical protein
MTPHEKEQLEKIRNLESEAIEYAKQYGQKNGSIFNSTLNEMFKNKMLEMKLETDSFLKYTKIKTTLHEVNKPALSENINTLNGYLR